MTATSPAAGYRHVAAAAADCHSLVRRLAAVPGSPVRWRAVRPVGDHETGAGRLWEVVIRSGRADPSAVARREAERRRPLHPGATIRVVRLRYTDGEDLIVVARRTRLSYGSLVAFAEALGHGLSAATGVEVTLSDSAHPLMPPASGPPPRHGAPTVVVERCAPVPDADLRAHLCAAAEAMARVTLQERVICDVNDLDGPSHTRWSVVVRDGAWVADKAGDDGTPPSLEVFAVTECADNYLPILGPPAPVAIVVHRGPTAGDQLSCMVDSEVLTPDLAGAVADLILHDRVHDLAAVRRAGDGGPPRFTPTCLHDAFAAVVRHDPEAIAVADGDLVLSYRGLEGRARSVAQALIRRGILVGDRVAIDMDRGPDMIVAIVAVLQAGGVYVPLDPHHPAERRNFIVEDAGARLIIVDAGRPHDESGIAAAPIAELLDEAGPLMPMPASDPDRAAYLIYTSGTTGRPKGVAVAHRGVYGLVEALRYEFRLAPDDVWSVSHSVAFDFSVWEIWGCLLTGGRLVVVPYWTARSPQDAADLIRRQGVTILNQTPSAFAGLSEVLAAHPGRGSLRLVIFGGETLHTPMLTDWIRRNPVADCRLVNMFGITETTVHVTLGDVTADDVVNGSSRVGRAIAGWSVSVRDDQGNLLPFAVPGEICVAGVGLAIGYHRRPDLDALRFVSDSATGERYYRSGDLGRLHADGTVEHLGRLDDQVKIRGHRVELGEIQAALLADPAISEAAVGCLRDPDLGLDETVICAWLVLAEAVTPAELRRKLRHRLPEYMVPSRLFEIAAIPLTANGKIDFRQLAEHSMPAAAAQPPPAIASQPDPTAVLLSIWQQLFGADAGADETFFDLGGNSLLALRLGVLLRQHGLPTLSPRDIYLNPTVGNLVALLAAR